jgi:iron(III) transport system permease protein
MAALATGLRPGRSLLAALAVATAVVVFAPLLAVAWRALAGSGGAGGDDTWSHLAATVLPEYLWNTLLLCGGVGAGAAALGVGSAWLVARYRFPGSAVFDWALVLPLAVPAYVLAYVYTDWLQYVGPVQSALRRWFGWRRSDYWFPDVRSLGGAVAMLSLALYPYVYMLARTAFIERGAAAIEAGRALGLTPAAAFWRLSLPLARPAIAGGLALALMETLADFGTVGYFGVPTFTTGIYRAWFALGDRGAAAQLAMLLLGFVLAVLLLERAARGRARFTDSGGRRTPPQVLRGWRAAFAALGCLLPLAGGFLLPGALLLKMALTQGDAQFGARFVTLAGHSLLVAALASALALLLALVVAYGARVRPGPATTWAHRAAGLGYALPGTVVAVGVLLPLGQLDRALDAAARALFDAAPGLVLGGSIAALVYACVVRYLTAALQSVDAGLARITPRMDDAARSLGHGAGSVLLRVHLPLLKGSALTGLLLVFIDVMKELPATLVLRPFDFDTLATQAYTLASDERLAEASTAALAIVGAGLLPMIVLCRQIARR